MPPALEELIAQAIARQMKKNRVDKSVLEFLLSKDGISLPDGVDLLFEELRGSGEAIRGPRCSLCGSHLDVDTKIECHHCRRYLCERCRHGACRCGRAASLPERTHLKEALWMATGVYGSYLPPMGVLYLLDSDPLALAYCILSMISLCIFLAHERELPWISIARQLALV